MSRINFEPVESQTLGEMPIVLQTQGDAARQLFEFVQRLGEGRVRVDRPIFMSPADLKSWLDNPTSLLKQELHQQVERYLLQVGPPTYAWDTFEIRADWILFLLALHNCVSPADVNEKTLQVFTQVLVESVLPAETLGMQLTYHVLLDPVIRTHPALSKVRLDLLRQLLDRSPLTGLYHLDWHTSGVLTRISADILPHWRQKVRSPAPWRDVDAWLTALVPILAEPPLLSALRYRWLELPLSREACRNIGLVLEALRRTGGYQDEILAYYEAYDYFGAEAAVDEWNLSYRQWPIFAKIETLLRAGGREPNKLTQTLNRYGNEYLTQFYPMLQIFIEDPERRLSYHHLTLALYDAIRPLLAYASFGQQGLDLGGIEWGEGEE